MLGTKDNDKKKKKKDGRHFSRFYPAAAGG